MRYYSFAVPNNSQTSKASSNKLSHQVFESKAKDRIIYNSSNLGRASNNWRADYYRFSNFSYAQVLRRGKLMSNMFSDHNSQHKIISPVYKNKTKMTARKVKSTHKVPRDKSTHTKQVSDTAKHSRARPARRSHRF